MKRPDGIILISLFHYLVAALVFMGILALLLIPLIVGATTLATVPREAGIPIAVTTIVVIIAGGTLLIWAGVNLAVGIGVWNMRPWARIGAIVLAAFRLFNFPVGTLIGGLTIWYLLREDIEPLFRT